jgi:regulator of nucleoside diphosphate kinase
MTNLINSNPKPRIVIGQGDYQQLLGLTDGTSSRWAEAADELLSEMERAQVVDAVPPQVVRMGSVVLYRPDNGPEREVTLVYPAEADISAGRISVLTPVGTALLGLAAGQTISWEGRNGREHELTVVGVK